MISTISSMPSTIVFTVSLLAIYLFLVRWLRLRRCRHIASAFEGGRRPLSSMTTAKAGQILRELQELEFPFTLHLALKTGLLKTAAIPTISKLLVATGQLSKKNFPKRAIDTEVLLVEVQSNEPDSLRHMQAIARMNYLHARYRQAGKILDEDMLHTLASGIVEPFRLLCQNEWRDLTSVERCAFGVFHKAMGDAMGVPFDLLPSSKEGWRDGLHFAEEVVEWVSMYEGEVARPTHSNIALGERFLDGSTRSLPMLLRKFARHAICALLEDHIREAMGLSHPSVSIVYSLRTILFLRKWMLLYLFLPRPSNMAVKLIDESPNPLTGLYNYNHYTPSPIYVRPTLWNQWGPRAWFSRIFNLGTLPGDKSKYYPQGYNLRTIGPTAQEGKGAREMEKDIRDMGKHGGGRCPFHQNESH